MDTLHTADSAAAGALPEAAPDARSLQLLLGEICACHGDDGKAVDLKVLGEEIRRACIRINQQQTGSGGHRDPVGGQPKAADPSSLKDSEQNRASK